MRFTLTNIYIQYKYIGRYHYECKYIYSYISF